MTSFPISISGSGLIEGERSRLFVPRLNNKYEQSLYEKTEKISGIEHWYVNQFNGETQGTHLDMVSNAFDQAIKSAELHRKINKNLSSKVGVIYFNMYGPTSFMNKAFQVKEMYQSDVFPAFLLNSHNITGYSIRLRCERNGVFQAMALARTLIQSGELDVVVIGGVFQAHSYFYLTEMQSLLQWQSSKNIKNKKTSSSYTLTESAGFLVIESTKTNEKRKSKSKINITDLISFTDFKNNNILQLKSLNTAIKSTPEIKQCYLGLNARDEIAKVESMLLKDLYPTARQINSYNQYGDLANINVIKVLHEHIKNNTEGSSLLHSIDRDNSAWNIVFNNNHHNKI